MRVYLVTQGHTHKQQACAHSRNIKSGQEGCTSWAARRHCHLLCSLEVCCGDGVRSSRRIVMGNRPSRPTEEQTAELLARQPELLARAASAINHADVLLLATGAGWSADSGLAVYKDVADRRTETEDSPTRYLPSRLPARRPGALLWLLGRLLQ